MITYIGLFILLIPCVITDIFRMELPLYYMLLFLVLSGCCRFMFFDGTLLEILLGTIPGFLFILLSGVSKGAIGIGDGVLVGAVGVWCGFSETLLLLILAFTLSSLAALLLLALKKKKLHDPIPFAPFLGLSAILSFGLTVL